MYLTHPLGQNGISKVQEKSRLCFLKEVIVVKLIQSQNRSSKEERRKEEDEDTI